MIHGFNQQGDTFSKFFIAFQCVTQLEELELNKPS